MPNPRTEQLDYATPSPTRSGFPRWLVVVGTALIAVWLLVQIIAALTSPQPAVAARYLVFGNLYEITAVAVCVAVYFFLRRHNQVGGRRLSYLAVFASLAVVLNPCILHIALYATGLLWMGFGYNLVRSFAAGVVALAAGIVSLVRIRRSRGMLTGMPFAVIGMVGGGLWVALWISLFVAFAIGMSGWH